MKTLKKYTAIKVIPKESAMELKVKLSYGEIKGVIYDKELPQTEFDTEEEAILYAQKTCLYSTWMIVPIVRFEPNY